MIVVKAKQWSERLSPNFQLHEFRCRCTRRDCLVTMVDTELVDLLEETRDEIERPIKITSGYRCKAHNATIPGAAKDSTHLQGEAADILVPDEFHAIVDKLVGNRGGVGFYRNRLHVDVRGKRARWGKFP